MDGGGDVTGALVDARGHGELDVRRLVVAVTAVAAAAKQVTRHRHRVPIVIHTLVTEARDGQAWQ